MTILTKITGNEETCNKLLFGCHLGAFSSFRIEGEDYYLFYPYQAFALQELGVGLEFYKSNKSLYREFPIVPEETEVEKIDLKPQVEDLEKFDRFLEKLRKKLEGGKMY